MMKTKTDNDILSPAEWIEEYDENLKKWINDGGHTTLYDIENMLSSYARHVAARVARNVQHRAAEIAIGVCYEIDRRPYYQLPGHLAPSLEMNIMNIPLRDVYPEWEE